MERLNKVLKLRLRVFSEERGMKALGRLAAGEVVCCWATCLNRLEWKLFGYLPRVASCAFIDSRVLLPITTMTFQPGSGFYQIWDGGRKLNIPGCGNLPAGPWSAAYR